MIKINHLVGCLILAAGAAAAQDTEDLISMSLEDILKMDIVSVSKKAENLFDSPLSASVITREEILNSGATTFEECLRLLPGLIVREESHGNYDIHIRGYDNIPPGNFSNFSENTMMLVMIDGRKVFNQLNGGTFWESLPVSLDDIERIEVIRGPATSLYGPNAVTGVIHIITRRATKEKDRISGNLILGSPATSEAEMNGFLRLGHGLGMEINLYGEKRERFENTYYEYLSGKYVPYDSLSAYQIDPSATPVIPEMTEQNISKKRYGAAAGIEWQGRDRMYMRLNGGIQNSRAQSVFMETSATPYSIRTSETAFVNLDVSAFGFQFHISHQNGTQEINEGFTLGTKFDMHVTDGSLEYAWDKGWIKLRPGLSIQEAMYDDTPYLSQEQLGQGYLNDARTLNNSAYYLRTEIRPTQKLRMIAAVRTDYYNYPDTAYVNYQLASTYKISENHLIRAVYSRSNRGPFFMDIYTDAVQNIGESTIKYIGNKNIRLPLTDMMEIGLRSRLNNNVQLDLEAFYNETRDITSFEPDVLTSIFGREFAYNLVYKYMNINGIFKQTGITGNINFVLSRQCRGRVFGTLQKSSFENYDWKVTPIIIDPDKKLAILPRPDQEPRSFTHKRTPAFFGGMTMNYNPGSRWQVNVSLYFMSTHRYRHDYASYNEVNGETEVPWKLIPIFYVNYRLYDRNSLYISIKNGFQNQSEFGFTEKIGLSVMGGIRFRY